MDKNIIYTGKMKAAEIITADWNLLAVFERFNIKLGFGEATVAELCKQHNISTELFLMICNTYSSNSYRPNADALSKEDIPCIVSYLRTSHRYYIDRSFPQLHNNIHIMMEEYEESSRCILNKFFDDYDCEIKKHFEYEEEAVFPYIENLLAGKVASNAYNIKKFAHNHTNVEEKLNDLKNIIIKYLPGNYTSDIRMQVLYEIFKIENDLHKHAMVENKLLIPMVAKLESENERG